MAHTSFKLLPQPHEEDLGMGAVPVPRAPAPASSGSQTLI